MKNVDFILSDDKYSWIDAPIPAINAIPEWYRSMPSFTTKKFSVFGRSTNQTAKRCIPFLDSMSSGYYFTLPGDIFVNNENDGASLNWMTYTNIVESHDLQQTINLPIPQEYDHVPFKFVNFWIMKTPPGYSTLFVHPLNRIDLPFYSLSGVVDTDKHNVPINFPFFIKRNFSGKIEKGTPIIQAIPFKRNNWKSTSDKILPDGEISKRLEKHFSVVERVYKKFSWTRKIYE